MRNKLYIFLLVFVVGFPSSLLAINSIEITSDDQKYNVARYSKYLVDETTQLTFVEVSSEKYKDKYLPIKKNIPNFGINNFGYWFHFKIKNMIKGDLDLVLSIEYANLDYIDLYYSDGKEVFRHKKSGDLRPFKDREIKNRLFNFKISLAKNQVRDVYLRVQTRGAAEVPMYLMSESKFVKQDHESQLTQGIFVGLLSVLSLYNFFIWIGSRNREHFFISLLIAMILLLKTSLDGLTLEYLWPDSIWWSNQATVFFPLAMTLVSILCAYVFLPVDDYPIIKLSFQVSLVSQALNLLGTFIYPYTLLYVGFFLGGISNVGMLIASFYIYKKGFKPARLFFIAWAALVVGSLGTTLQKTGVLGVSFFTEYGIEIGTVVLSMFITLSQAEKINIINREIRSAKEKALQAQIEVNRVTEEMKNKLELKVQERTQTIATIVENVKSGFLMINRNFEIEEGFTKSCHSILGSKISPGNIFPSLFDLAPREQEHFELAIGQVFDDLMPEKVTLSQIKKRYKIADKYLSVDGSVVRDQGGSVQNILFTIADTTQLVEAEKEISRNSGLLKIIQEKIIFKSFIRDALHYIKQAIDEIARNPNQKPDTLLHTLKGNFLAFRMDDIAEYIHELEGREFISFVDLDEIASKVKSFLHTHKDVLGINLDSLADEQFTVMGTDLNLFRQKIEKIDNSSSLLSEFDSWSSRIKKVAIEELTAHFSDDIENTAKKLGKRVTYTLVGGRYSDRSLSLPPRFQQSDTLTKE